MILTDSHVVSIRYTVTDGDGETLDTSADGDPLTPGVRLSRE